MSSRRSFLRSAALAAAALGTRSATAAEPSAPLEEFAYGDVELAPGPAETQFEQTCAVLLSLNEDSLLKPWRLRAGLPAPGPELGGWYDELPLEKTESGGHGFAPAHCFGQWISALSRAYAVHHAPEIRARLERLLALYAPTISGRFYTNFRFPAYNYDKMVIGLIDAHQFAGIPEAFALLDRTTAAAEPHLPPHALNRDEPQRQWRQSIGENTSNDYTWDENYTLPENLYLAAQRGAGERYRTLAARFLLDDTWFTPLSENRNVLAGHHAYSFCNSLSSAMQAYLAAGSRKHLLAARNAFDMIAATQSFATGGWGPNESFVAPGQGELFRSLTATHRGFETPCGSYAHCKLTRYLLRVTRDGRYGDSMERVFYNTVLGARPLERDGRAFYYSDYNDAARKVYFPDRWPCCSGTLPQVAADYRLLPYFRDPAGIFVNLYLPSTLRWTDSGGAQLALTQSGAYPWEGRIAMRLRSSRPAPFALRLRIPGWTTPGAVRLSVNGEPVPARAQSGFVTLQRTWRDGDRLQLDFDLPLRLEPIDPDHPDTVALLRGPLVLFAMDTAPAALSRRQLLAAERMPDGAWQVQTSTSVLRFQPFVLIGDQPYRTYLKVA
ncbi:MAG TPA: beta-L-arabinofuranosidase domain-containing protein [Bryobacteraceae bacterium]|nr:beta-L-arabinofuranosidase domain-containing protein [Bryobacteraceae bacterium]